MADTKTRSIKAALSLEEFKAQSKDSKILTNWYEFHSDIETPVSIYAKLSKLSADAFLFESVIGGDQVGRYSFVGFEALDRISFAANSSKNGVDVYEEFKAKLANYGVQDLAALDFFHRGYVGYGSFETIQAIEPSLQVSSKANANPHPDLYMLLVGKLVVFDHVTRSVYLIVNQEANGDVEAQYQDSCRAIEDLYTTLNQYEHGLVNLHTDDDTELIEMDANTDSMEFASMVQTAKQHILEGDIFQVVLSRKLHKQKACDPLKLYRILRSVNPSPYQFLFNVKNDNGEYFSLVGSSPEVFVKTRKVYKADRNSSNARLVNSEKMELTDASMSTSKGECNAAVEDLYSFIAEVRPIAGTYKRGKTEAEDNALAQKLLDDTKEIAEHVMLVDLARNDLGRVAKNGTVQLAKNMIIERYSHVMHIVSSVEATLAEYDLGTAGVELTKACFPAGTLSGAPKVKAIEIIQKLEKEARGPYGGFIGYYSLDGNVNTAIMIRTLLVEDKQVTVQAGAGIVADSVEASEFQETLNKAGALIKVVSMA